MTALDDSQLVAAFLAGNPSAFDEIAETLAIPPGTVKSQLSRAREKLRAELPAELIA